jgi:hypothetical protein
VSREPNLDELIDAGTTGAERRRLEHVHDLLLQAGPPPELTPQLRNPPTFGVVPLQLKRRDARRRTLVLLAAAVAIAAIFAVGYGVGNLGGSSSARGAQTIALQGIGPASHARATLQVWHFKDGNLPMTLSVVGLPKLPARSYYDVYLVRDGKVQPWGVCGSFSVSGSSRELTLNFSAPYPLQKGDTWVVTRPGPGGTEPGRTVLRPVSA